MKIISENVINGENIAAHIIDTILNMTEHNPVSLSGILGLITGTGQMRIRPPKIDLNLTK